MVSLIDMTSAPQERKIARPSPLYAINLIGLHTFHRIEQLLGIRKSESLIVLAQFICGWNNTDGLPPHTKAIPRVVLRINAEIVAQGVSINTGNGKLQYLYTLAC